MCALLLVTLPGAAWPALSIPVMPADGSVTVEQLESAIRAVEASGEISDENRVRVVEQLRDAELQVQNRIAAEARAATYAEALNSAPAETEALLATLDDAVHAPPTAESLGIDDDAGLAEFEQALSKALGDLAAVDARWTELGSQIEAQGGRPAIARERINDLSRSREELAALIDHCYRLSGQKETVILADRLRTLGFTEATRSGLSIAMHNMVIPEKKEEVLARCQTEVEEITNQYVEGLITDGERYNKVIDIWSKAAEEIATAMMDVISNDVVVSSDGKKKESTPS